MKRRDWLWILAFPVYFLINSFRHELAHALSALLEGARMLALSFWPHPAGPTGPFWNGAMWQGQTSWMTSAMPYLFDLITFVFFFYFCMAVPFQHRWMWINLIAIGLISPLLNSGINYMRFDVDIRVLAQVFPPAVVDLYFGLTTAFYLGGLGLVLFFSRTSLPSIPPAEMAAGSIPSTGSFRG